MCSDIPLVGWLHKWTKWKDGNAYTIRHHEDDGGDIRETGIIQERRCTICNKLEMRKVKETDVY
jgi:hypothetical protein